MLIRLCTLGLTILFFHGALLGQIVKDSATYSNAVGVQEIFNPSVASTSNCVDTLTVNIPAGNWIYGVDLHYTLESVPGFFFGNSPSDIDTYLECLTTGTKENQLFAGLSNTNGATENVSRTNLQFANGAVSGTEVQFFLHAFENTFFGTACDTSGAKIKGGTWKVVVHHGTPPTCFKPTQLATDYVMHNRARVSWQSGGATNWQIEYGTAGFTQGSGTLINATSNPFTISGLTPNTSYEFYVRDSCATGNVSVWSNGASFTTICNPLTFTTSFQENFDGAGWTNGGGALNSNNTIGNCWQRNPQAPNSNFFGNYAWGTGTGATPSANTGPNQDKSGSGNYIYTEASAGNNQDEATLTSPLIDLSPLTVPKLEFAYHRYGGSVGALEVWIWNQSLGWQKSWSQTGPENQSSSTAAWTDENITLNNYINDTIRLRFRGVRSFNLTGDLAIDAIEIEEAPTCPDPSNLAVSSRSSGSVTLSWNSTNASSWNVEYGVAGFAKGSGNTLSLNSNPGTVSGLSSGTIYDFYLQSQCSGSDTSNWIGPISAITFCTATAAPYGENFDSSPWLAGTGVYSAGDSLAPCWWRNPGRGSSAVFPVYWAIRSAASTTPNTGPNADFSGSGNYAYTESSAGSLGQDALLETPLIDVSTLTTPELRFHYHLFGNSMGTLAVNVYSAANQTWSNNLFSLSGQQQSSGVAAWQEAIVDLSAFSSDSIVIQFAGTKGNERRSDMAIDEVKVQEAPQCPQPDSLSVSNITQTSMQLNWNSGGATNWLLEYGPSGFSLGNGTLVPINSNPHTLTGLSASQVYDFYLRDSCGTGNVSTWIGPTTAQTLCGISTAPWNEKFDGSNWSPGTGPFNTGNAIDACWSRPPSGNPNFGTGSGQTASGGTGPNSDLSGNGQYIYTEASGGATGGGSIETPRILLPGTLNNPNLEFYYFMFGNGIDSLAVEIDNGSGFSYLWSIAGEQQTSLTDPWNLVQIDLSTHSGDTVQLRFTGYNSGFAGDIAIDEVSVKEISCPQPSQLQVTATTSNSATLSWNSGGATNWEVEYGPVGFAPGSGTRVSVSAIPFTVSGLTSGTAYDFYVRDSCGAANVSAFTGPVNGKTNCLSFTAPYTENFDGNTWNAGTGGFNVGNTIDVCWNRPDTLHPHFGPLSGPSASANTGPNADFSGSGQYIYTEYSGGVNGPGEITSPLVVIPISFTNPRLQFQYHLYGNAIDSLVYFVNQGGNNQRLGALIGAQQAAGTDAWQLLSEDINSYAGDTISITFKGYSNAFPGDIAIDEFALVDESCPKPTGLIAPVRTQNSISLSWTTGGATNWQIEYGPAGFNIGQGTLITVATNPFTVTGLNPGTFYDFYVRDSCGAADISSWSNLIRSSTLCDTIMAPHTENFDFGFDRGVDPAGAQNVNSTISPCWWRDADTNYFWGGGTAGTPTFGTGPLGDHTSGNGNYVYVESSFAAANSTAELQTPYFKLDSLQFPEMRFWYQMWEQNGTQGKLVWEIDSGSGWIALDSLDGNQGFAWQEQVSDLRNYSGTTVQIRFRATKAAGANAQQGDIALDDFSLIEGPACPDPDSLNLISRSQKSLELDWVTGLSNQWLVRHKPLAAVTFTYSSALSKPFTVSGLKAETNYVVCVRDSCGPGDVSNWICDTLSTSCLALSLPYAENFDGTGWNAGQGFNNLNNTIGSCWDRPGDEPPHFGTNNGGTGSNNTGPSTDVSGTGNYIYTEYSGVNAGFGSISSPLIFINSTATHPELSFGYHLYGATIDSLQVQIDNGASTVAVWSLAGSQQTASTDPFQFVGIDLSAFKGDSIRVIFNGYGRIFASDIAIDEVEIKDVTCPVPDSLFISNTTTTSVDVGWAGTAANTQIEYGPRGFSIGTGTRVLATTNPFSLTGLSPGTFYDFYVRDICASGDTSLWSSLVTGFTLCTTITAPYTENFDNGFSEGNGFANVGSTISPCWTRHADSNYFWGGGQGATTSAGTGPTGDHTSGNGNYVYVEASTGAANDIATLESPQIDLSNLTDPEMRFWLHAFSQNNNPGKLVWEVKSGSGAWTAIDSVTASQGNFWLEQVVDLSAYANQSITVRFRAHKAAGASSFQGDFSVDDLTIDEKQLCPALSMPYTENFDGTNWSEGNGGLNNNDAIDPCWNRPATAQIRWGTGTGTTPSANTGPNSDVSGSGNYLYTEASRGAGGTWINTPPLAINSAKVNPYLWFSYFMYGNAIDTLAVQVNNGSGWSANLLTIFGEQQTAPNQPWRRDSLDLSAYSGDTIEIRFRGASTNFTGDIAIDEIKVDELIQTCPTPTNLSVKNITQTSMQVNWNSAPPGGNTYLMYFDLATGPAGLQVVPNVSSPYTLSGLSGNSSYEISVRDSCPGTFSAALFDTVATAPCDTVQAAFSFTTNLLSASFDGSATAFADTLIWNFGDGNSDTALSPVHNYAGKGTYTVTLIAFNTCGSSDTLIQQVQVCDSLKAGISLTSNLDSIIYNSGPSLGATGYFWDFGDGNTDSSASGSHQYTLSGNYTVTLVVVNECGERDSTSVNITICGQPVADWTFTVLPPTGSGMRVQFDASASVNAVSYNWSFGDGSFGTGVAPLHVYGTPGLFYFVSLTVTNACGDTDVEAFRLQNIGVEEYNLATELQVFPVPSTGLLRLEWKDVQLQLQNLRLTDMQGRTVYESAPQENAQGQYSLNLSFLAKGAYLLEVTTNKGLTLKRVLLH